MSTLSEKSFVATCSFFLLISCATTQAPGTKPEDMSYKEHLAAADRETQTADTHNAQYDPDALEQEPDRQLALAHGGGQWGDFDLFNVPGKIYNPTAYHKKNAEKHAEHAQQHEEAAEALRHFEQQECSTINATVRPLSPLLGTIKRVEPINGGARIVLNDDVNSYGVFAHAQCHRAFGAFTGYKDMPNCPLYLKNLQIRMPEEGAIELVSDDAKTAKQILRRSRTHVLQ